MKLFSNGIQKQFKNKRNIIWQNIAPDQIKVYHDWQKEQMNAQTETIGGSKKELQNLNESIKDGLTKQEVVQILAERDWDSIDWKKGIKDGLPKSSARYVLALQAGLRLLGIKDDSETEIRVDAFMGRKTKQGIKNFHEKYLVNESKGKSVRWKSAPGPVFMKKLTELLGGKITQPKPEEKKKDQVDNTTKKPEETKKTPEFSEKFTAEKVKEILELELAIINGEKQGELRGRDLFGAVQTKLKELNMYSKNIDGYQGNPSTSATVAGLKKYQKENKLLATGTPTKQTIEHMLGIKPEEKKEETKKPEEKKEDQVDNTTKKPEEIATTIGKHPQDSTITVKYNTIDSSYYLAINDSIQVKAEAKVGEKNDDLESLKQKFTGINKTTLDLIKESASY